jgi:sec-independent protein translocase protein TatA
MLVLLAIVALVFGTKRLRNIGEDVGSAIKSFRKGMQDGDGDAQPQLKADPPQTTQSTSNDKSERVG